MSVDDFFQRLITALEQSGVPYMVTGSYASAAHGVPRATNDIDVVIAPMRDQLRAFVNEFPGDRYYADDEAALEALQHRSQFNIIDFATGWKADLIIRKNRRFSTEEFARRRRHKVAGISVSLATAEDILLAKLEWYKEGKSPRQLEDVIGIIRRQRTELNRPYVEYWAHELDVEEEWHAALAGAG